jgi:hypothetical protein
MGEEDEDPHHEEQEALAGSHPEAGRAAGHLGPIPPASPAGLELALKSPAVSSLSPASADSRLDQSEAAPAALTNEKAG